MTRSRLAPLRLALVVAATAACAVPGRGQTLETVGGAVIGAGGGAVVTMAILVGNARAGRFVHSPRHVRWELLPVPVGALAGGILGHGNPDRLWRSMGWGAAGLAVGAAGGALTGRILWGPSEGTWSGAVVGSAAGMLAGALVGALTWDGGDPAPVQLQLSLPFGP